MTCILYASRRLCFSTVLQRYQQLLRKLCAKTQPWHEQAEGETMSRKNGEVEGAQRKLRSQMRKLESEKERQTSRLASLEASLAGEQERAMHATQAAAMQVPVFAHSMPCLPLFLYLSMHLLPLCINKARLLGPGACPCKIMAAM